MFRFVFNIDLNIWMPAPAKEELFGTD